MSQVQAGAEAGAGPHADTSSEPPAHAAKASTTASQPQQHVSLAPLTLAAALPNTASPSEIYEYFRRMHREIITEKY